MGLWVLLFRDAQRRASHSDGDAMVLEAVEEGIDQWFSLKESVPVAVLEIGCDHCSRSAVTFIHQSEEGIGLFRFEGQIPKLVNQ